MILKGDEQVIFDSFDGMIFDLDGTLIDSEHIWEEIDKIFFSKRGLSVPEDYAQKVATMDLYEAAVFTRELVGLDETPEEMLAEWGAMAIHEYANNIKPVPSAAEFLEQLRSSGKKIALATASNEKLYTAVLKSNGMYSSFDCFVTTAEVTRGKEHPDVYRLAAEKLGLPPEKCLVFEDKVPCIRAAKRGGFAVAACLFGAPDAEAEALRAEADLSYRDYIEFCKR